MLYKLLDNVPMNVQILWKTVISKLGIFMQLFMNRNEEMEPIQRIILSIN